MQMTLTVILIYLLIGPFCIPYFEKVHGPAPSFIYKVFGSIMWLPALIAIVIVEKTKK